MVLDKWISVCFLAISIIYGYASFQYPLLPFEKNMAFLPNTMPMALSVLGVAISLVLIFAPRAPSQNEQSSTDTDLSRFKHYKSGQAIAILAAMVIYALLLRPLGFVPSTVCFLVVCGWVLGERKFPIMLGVALIATLGIWYLVQEILGIYLKPLPWFIAWG